MANRFFPGIQPQKGKPFSMRGLMWGICSMANALARMKIVGGHIEWSAWNEPTIVIDPSAITDVQHEAGFSGGSEPEPTAQDFPSDVVSIDDSANWKKSVIQTATPAAIPSGFLTKDSSAKLKLSVPAAATNLNAIYGTSGSSFSKLTLGSNEYAFPYEFLTRNSSGVWKWVTPSGSVGEISQVVCKNESGNMTLASVVEFTCPTGTDDIGFGTDETEA